MFKKSWIDWLTIAILALIGIVAVGLFYLHNEPAIHDQHSTPSQKEITIGWIGPLTGNMTALGADSFKSIQLAIKQYNMSHQPAIRLIVANSTENADTTLQIYKNMVLKQHAKLIFVIFSKDVITLAKEAVNDQVLLVDPIDNDHTLVGLSPNIFLIAKTTESLSAIIANNLIAQKKDSILILYLSNEAFMKTLATSLKNTFSASGGKVYFSEFSGTETDFKSILQPGITNHVKAYVFFGFDNIGLAMLQARNMGIKEPFYTVNMAPKLEENSKGAADRVLFPYFTSLDGNPILAKQFLRSYKENYGNAPSLEWVAMQSYDAIEMIIYGISKVAVDKNFIENLRNYLLTMGIYQGTSGNILIKSDGSSQGIYPSLYILKKGNPYSVKSDYDEK